MNIEDYLFEETGKSFSDIIRHWKEEAESKSSSDSIPEKEGGILDLIENSKFQYADKAIRRYLMILSQAHEQEPHNFDKILKSRIEAESTLGTSRDELSRRGKNVRPEKIPDPPYWAITRINNSTKKKRLWQALLLLDYDRDVATKAVKTID